MQVNYVIVFVSDMQRSIQFYRDTVGMPLKFESPEWTEFVTEGATFALHHADAQSSDAESPATPRAGETRPGFSVPDLDAFHSRMTDASVRVVQEPRDVFGARIAQYRDPDGIVFSVSQAR